MNARDEILASIRARRITAAPRPPAYHAPVPAGDLAGRFAERATAIHAEVRVIDRLADAPAAVGELLRARNLAAEVFLPLDAELNTLPWSSNLTVKREAPGPDDTAVALAPFAIAETGTLVYPARANSPAVWHFRPGFEIAIVRGGDILPQMEDVLARIKETGAIPHTINFVSGPSRTGDIEQTLELGAHGPKALAVLIVKD